MRTVPAGSFERLSSLEALWQAWKRYRQGKRRQPRVAAFDRRAEHHVWRLHQALRAGHYRPGSMQVRLVRDPKLRLIAAAPIVDRVVHQALVSALAPHIERRFIHHSYACGTGRGVHRAVLVHLGWMRAHRFRLGLDVAQFFASIPHDRLLTLLGRSVRDARTLALCAALLSVGGAVYQTPLARSVAPEVDAGCGLALGTLLSQWSANVYLDGLDHFVKRTLKIGAYLRYMDDFTLFADRREVLEDARASVADWLSAERGLTLNPKRLAVRPTSVPCTWLGYRTSRAGLTPGRKMRRRMRRKLNAAAEQGDDALARTLAATAAVVSFG